MTKYLVIILFCLSFSFVHAQNEYDDEVPPSDTEEFVGFNKKGKEKKKRLDECRLRIGGTANFGVGNGQIGFSASPTVGYMVVEDRIEIGTGILYNFYRFKDDRVPVKYVENTVGSNNYVRVFVWEGLFAQFRGVYQKTYVKLNGVSLAPIRLGNVFGGAGYQYKISERGFINFGLEINLIPYDLSVVNSRSERIISPFFQFQFCF